MPVAKLTKRFVGAIETSSRRVIYYDSELKGFGLKVTPTGAKCWCVEYRPRGGGRGTAKYRMVLGSAHTLTPDQARQEACSACAFLSRFNRVTDADAAHFRY